MKTPLQNQTKSHAEKHGATRRSAPAPARGFLPRPVPPALVAHVFNTLPDSLSRREELLRSLAACIPAGEESGVWVRALQFHLQEHQRLRFDWPCPAE
jgi:hypothetical protein